MGADACLFQRKHPPDTAADKQLWGVRGEELKTCPTGCVGECLHVADKIEKSRRGRTGRGGGVRRGPGCQHVEQLALLEDSGQLDLSLS